MANRSLGSLTLNLIAEIGGYVGPLSKAERATAAASAKMKKDIEQVAKAGTLFATGIATAFGALVKHSIDLQDEMSKASQKIGVSVSDLSKLNYAADLSGVAFESLVSALGKFNKNLAEAYTSGTGAAADALADLGIKTADASGNLKSTNDVFLEVADRLSGLEDGAIKTSLAMDLFGKSGADLIPLLNSGKAGLADMATEAEKLGQVLDADAAKKAEEFNDNLTRLQKTFSGVANAVAMEALPELTEFSDKIKDPAFQEGLASLAKGLTTVVGSLVNGASAIGNFTKNLAEGAAAAINGITADDIPRLTERLEELNKALAPQNSSNNILTGVQVTDVLKSTEALEKERKIILGWIEADKQYQAQKAKAAQTKPATNADLEDPFKLTDAQVKAARELREAQKKASEDAAAQAKQLQKTFADSLANLQREIDLYNQVSKTSELRYETEKGNLKDLNAAQKEQLINLANISDLRERDRALVESQRAVDLAAMGDKGQLESVQYEYDLKHNIIQLNDAINAQDREKLINNKKLVEQFGEQAQIAELIKQQQRSIDLAGQTTKAAQTEYDIRHDILKVVGGIGSEQAKILIDQAKILDAQEKFKDASSLSQKAFERIEEAGTDIWLNLEDGFKGFRDSVLDSFKRLLAEMANEAITKPIILQVQQAIGGSVGGQAGGASSLAGAAANPAGLYAAGALVAVAAISKWNAQQDEKFKKLTAEYKQANQGLSLVLGEGNVKSQTIANGITALTKSDGDVLDVNNKMLTSLEGIRSGIGDIAAGFARTLTGSGNYEAMGIKEGTTTSPILDKTLKGFGIPNILDELTGGFLGDFLGGVVGSISKAIYSKKKSVTDSGIQIIGTSLADILSGATVQAFNYADVKTKKKFLGVTTSTKVKRSREDIDVVFEEQITGVFEDAAEALREASGTFGIDFEKYVDQLKVNASDISLKGLEGDALTKELESFFSKTLDDWAGALLGAGNTRILEDFQKVGESAFDTMLRLAAETKTFAKYADSLNLNFHLAGVNAVYAAQAIADFAGGFDQLGSSLSTYYDKFFDESDKFLDLQTSLTKAFGDLGETLPTTRDGFKDIISGLNLANEADQKRFASLIKLSGATDEYITALDREQAAKADAVKAAEEAAKASEEAAKAARQALKDAAGTAFDRLTESVNRQKEAVQSQIDAANTALNSTRAVADSLTSTLKSMTLQSNKNELAVRRAAQAQIITAAAIARAGGPLPKQGQLDDALAIVAQPSQDLYASFEEYVRDFYSTSKNIKDLADATGTQQTIEEQNLTVLNSQLTALDDLVKYYQTQIDKLNDLDSSVISVRNAVLALTDALLDAGITPAEQRLPQTNYEYEAAQVQQNATFRSDTPMIVNASSVELLDKIDILTEQLGASQFAIAKNTLNTVKILQRIEEDGIPTETSST